MSLFISEFIKQNWAELRSPQHGCSYSSSKISWENSVLKDITLLDGIRLK
jgi:hypothetical protein